MGSFRLFGGILMVKLKGAIAKEQRPAGRRRGVGLVLEEIVIGLSVSKSCTSEIREDYFAFDFPTN